MTVIDLTDASRSSPTAAMALRITARTLVAERVVALTLASPRGDRLPDWAPGAHIDVVLPDAPGRPAGTVRQYSLCGDRWDSRTYRIAVLRQDAGRGGSARVHDDLAVGHLLGVGGPRNHFRLVPAPEYLFVAGGIGITPLLPMIDQAERLGVPWRLLYAGRSRATMAFLGDLARYGDRVDVLPTAERGRTDVAAWIGRAQDHTGRTKIYCCGPEPLVAAVRGACGAGTSWPVHTVHTEAFTTSVLPAPVRETPFTVQLSRTGASVIVSPEETVLDAIRRAGASVLSSCRQGTCGTCETAVLDGVPDHRDAVLSDHERATGDCLFVCVSRSCSDSLVLDL